MGSQRRTGGPIILGGRLVRVVVAVAVAAVAAGGAAARGWVGVDMILGPREDDDRVLEVNPRLTTSFVGLCRHARKSLVRTMLAVADGATPADGWEPAPAASDGCPFDACPAVPRRP